MEVIQHTLFFSLLLALLFSFLFHYQIKRSRSAEQESLKPLQEDLPPSHGQKNEMQSEEEKSPPDRSPN